MVDRKRISALTWRNNYYMNTALVGLFLAMPEGRL